MRWIGKNSGTIAGFLEREDRLLEGWIAGRAGLREGLDYGKGWITGRARLQRCHKDIRFRGFSR